MSFGSRERIWAERYVAYVESLQHEEQNIQERIHAPSESEEVNKNEELEVRIQEVRRLLKFHLPYYVRTKAELSAESSPVQQMNNSGAESSVDSLQVFSHVEDVIGSVQDADARWAKEAQKNVGDFQKLSNMDYAALMSKETTGKIDPPLKGAFLTGISLPLPNGFQGVSVTKEQKKKAQEVPFVEDDYEEQEGDTVVEVPLDNKKVCGIPLPFGNEIVATHDEDGMYISPRDSRLPVGAVNLDYVESGIARFVMRSCKEDVRCFADAAKVYRPTPAETAYWKKVLPLPEKVIQYCAEHPEDVDAVVAQYVRRNFLYVCHDEFGEFLRNHDADLPILVDELKMGHCHLLAWAAAAYYRQLGKSVVVVSEKGSNSEGDAFMAKYGHARVMQFSPDGRVTFFDPTAVVEWAAGFRPGQVSQDLLERLEYHYSQAKSEQEKRDVLRAFLNEKGRKAESGEYERGQVARLHFGEEVDMEFGDKDEDSNDDITHQRSSAPFHFRVRKVNEDLMLNRFSEDEKLTKDDVLDLLKDENANEFYQVADRFFSYEQYAGEYDHGTRKQLLKISHYYADIRCAVVGWELERIFDVFDTQCVNLRYWSRFSPEELFPFDEIESNGDLQRLRSEISLDFHKAHGFCSELFAFPSVRFFQFDPFIQKIVRQLGIRLNEGDTRQSLNVTNTTVWPQLKIFFELAVRSLQDLELRNHLDEQFHLPADFYDRLVHYFAPILGGKPRSVVTDVRKFFPKNSERSQVSLYRDYMKVFRTSSQEALKVRMAVQELLRSLDRSTRRSVISPEDWKLRDYEMESDDVRSIHWLRSAGRETPLVKVDASVKGQADPVHVFFDCCSDGAFDARASLHELFSRVRCTIEALQEEVRSTGRRIFVTSLKRDSYLLLDGNRKNAALIASLIVKGEDGNKGVDDGRGDDALQPHWKVGDRDPQRPSVETKDGVPRNFLYLTFYEPKAKAVEYQMKKMGSNVVSKTYDQAGIAVFDRIRKEWVEEGNDT